MSNNPLKKIADFLYEAGMLAKTPRSGFFFLGSGSQSVAEHTNRVCYIGYVLTQLTPEANLDTVLKMCLFHDFTESRISDLNHVHQKYTERFEHKALSDLAATVPFGKDIEEIIVQYEARETLEARIAKDADNLEFLIALKEQGDIGNKRALDWIPGVAKRLKTEAAQQVAQAIIETDSDNWWFPDRTRPQDNIPQS